MTTSKLCAACGRPFEYRAKWSRCWDQVRYCSLACRRRRVTKTDRLLELTMLDLLAARSGTLCPSEAARQVSADNWRALMEPVRCAARRLAASGQVAILQHGRPVKNFNFAGPIRIGRGASFAAARRS